MPTAKRATGAPDVKGNGGAPGDVADAVVLARPVEGIVLLDERARRGDGEAGGGEDQVIGIGRALQCAEGTAHARVGEDLRERGTDQGGFDRALEVLDDAVERT